MSTEVRATGNYWLYAVFGILGVTIVVNITMAVLGSNSNRGYIEDNTWERDQTFQTQLDARARFQELGWTPELSFSAADTDTKITLNSGEPLKVEATGFVIRLLGKRGDTSKLDFEATLIETSPGIYTGIVNQPLSGLWLFSVVLERNGVTFQFETRATIDLRFRMFAKVGDRA